MKALPVRGSVGLTLILFLLAMQGAYSQRVSSSVWSLQYDRLRVVFPTEEAIDTARAQMLIDILDDMGTLLGLPDDVLTGKRITISLAAEPTPGMDAVAAPSQRLIIVPFVDAFQWDPKKLHRVIRHELAHVGMGIYLNYSMPPPWFQEGYAEWAAGGLTCRGETRIRVDMMMRRRQQQPPPRIRVITALGRSQLSYAYLVTLFEYIDHRWEGVVTNGSLLEGLRDVGLHRAIPQVLGLDLETLLEEWQTYLAERYRDLPERLSCPPGEY